MNGLDIRDVDSVEVVYSSLRVHPELKCEMAHMVFLIGGMRLNLNFVSWIAMIEFCEKHNFPYEDDRGE